jgi:hypothetical protein
LGQRVNREAIAWLKEWDQCVFKRRLPNGAKKKRKFGAFGGAGGGEGKDGDEEVNTDPFGRPREKVRLSLLLVSLVGLSMLDGRAVADKFCWVGVRFRSC